MLVLCSPAAARAAAAALPKIAHPNPALVSAHPDYVAPIPGVAGAAASLPPLDPAVIAQAVKDQAYLAFKTTGDLGGFAPAPTGQLALSSGGHTLVGIGAGTSQIPQLAQAAGGQVSSFAAAGGAPATPPDQGGSPVPGLGQPPPVTPPSNNNNVPPPNQGFGGVPAPAPPPPTTTTPTTRPTPPPPPPTTTTAPTTTTSTTTTTPTTTASPPAAPPPSPPPGPSGASCGTAGLAITSDHSTCRIVALNMAPGGSASEVMTIRNDTAQPFTLSLQAAGTVNALWSQLRMGVWEVGTAAPSPLPALLLWTTQANTLATLPAGATIRYEIELFLPTTAGNTTQGLSASIDLVWRAQG